jgi:hypothetical protein
MNRIYHPYQKWEEVKFNMWGRVLDRDKFLKKAIQFTGNHKLYGKWMMRVVLDWKYSTEHNLTDASQNRQAWIGHAACAYAFQCPEDIIREAWHMLSDSQRKSANRQADKAIEYFIKHKIGIKNAQKEFNFQRTPSRD